MEYMAELCWMQSILVVSLRLFDDVHERLWSKRRVTRGNLYAALCPKDDSCADVLERSADVHVCILEYS